MTLDQYLSPQLLFSASALLVTWLVLRWWNQNRKLPPGPWGLPFFGYFPFIKTTHLDLAKLSEAYGDVCSFRSVGGKLFIVLNGAKMIKEVLVNRADEFIGRIPEHNLVAWFSNGYGVAQEDGEPWSEHRRFFLQAAKNFGFGKMELEERIHDAVRRMIADVRSAGSTEMKLDFHVSYVTNCIISHILFNKQFEKNEVFEKNISFMNQLIQTFVGKRNLLVGSAFDLYFAIFPSLKYGRDGVRKFTDGIVEEQMRTYDPGNLRGYVDAYLRQRDDLIKKGKRDGGTFTKERLQANAANMFFEGTESVSSTIVVLLLELAKHPDVQKKIQEELDSVVGSERLPSWGDRTKLPYLDATIQELYRVRSQFLITTLYSNFKETTIEGFKIPKRSAIVANLWSIHFDPELYPHPEKFDPNRFLDENGKRIKREGPYAFGLGKRACIGESLAQMEVFILISCVLQNFSLRPGKEEDTLRLIPLK